MPQIGSGPRNPTPASDPEHVSAARQHLLEESCLGVSSTAVFMHCFGARDSLVSVPFRSPARDLVHDIRAHFPDAYEAAREQAREKFFKRADAGGNWFGLARIRFVANTLQQDTQRLVSGWIGAGLVEFDRLPPMLVGAGCAPVVLVAERLVLTELGRKVRQLVAEDLAASQRRLGA